MYTPVKVAAGAAVIMVFAAGQHFIIFVDFRMWFVSITADRTR